MHADVRKFVATCDSCQRMKGTSQRTPGLLTPLTVPNDTWASVSMDLVTSLPQTSAGYTAIAVFVDRLSKMVRLAPCRDDTSAEEFADIFISTVFKSHGLPRQLVSDRDNRFTSKLWQSLMQKLHVTCAMSSAYRPQTDGQTERVNRVLEDMLRHFIDPAQSNWDKLLPLVEFAINDSYHESVQAIPFVLNYGKRPLLPLDIVLKGEETGTTSVTADRIAETIQNVVKQAKVCMEAAQQRQKAYADKFKRDVIFNEGDEVLLSTKNIKIKMKGTPKLLPKWLGPFKVIKMINPNAYKLQLPDSLKIHPVFHVSLLKPYLSGRAKPPPPPEVIDDEFEYEVESILDHEDKVLRRKRNRQKTPVYVRRYLVKWKGYDESYNTWEPESNCAGCPDKVEEYFTRLKQGVASNKRSKSVPSAKRRRRR